MRLRIDLLLLLILTAFCANAQLSYEQAQSRADRFFGYREWASASALYNYMLKQRPEVSSTYGPAIVANAMLNDSIQSMDLLKNAMAYKIPLDTVLSQVKKYAFVIGRGDLYEHFMLQAARENPWLARPIDHQLLKYYVSRNNAPKVIQYARVMLAGAPDDVRFLSALAKGYMLQGQTDEAVKIWQRILTLYPDNSQALLWLANFYASSGDTPASLKYFSDAQALHPTPYIAQEIAKLSGKPEK